ncbi:MAG: ATP-binding protein [Candidatus Sulfomarinibacteraceae bacterium]
MNGLDAASNGTGDRFVLIRSRLREDRMLEVSVEDSGAGVPFAEAGRVFEPFHTTKPGGMGLGLSICRTIVEAHGGKIWLDDGTKAKGAVFRFTLATIPEKDAA